MQPNEIKCIQKALAKILDSPLEKAKCEDCIHSLITFNVITDPNANDLNSTTFMVNSSFSWLINLPVTGRAAYMGDSPMFHFEIENCFHIINLNHQKNI